MFDERIDRYIAEDMAPGERSAFEAELARNPALRAELEEARATLQLAAEWFDKPAPGEDRVAALPIPQVGARPARVYTMNRALAWTLRAAAAVAIFLAGYATNAMRSDGTRTEVAEPPPSPPVEKEEKPAPLPPDSRVMAAADNFQRVTDNDGELIVETARSYWVVRPVEESSSTILEKR